MKVPMLEPLVQPSSLLDAKVLTPCFMRSAISSGGRADLRAQVVEFLREMPRVGAVRIAQEICPEIFRLPPAERNIHLAWLKLQLERMEQGGLLKSHHGPGDQIAWSASGSRRFRRPPHRQEL